MAIQAIEVQAIEVEDERGLLCGLGRGDNGYRIRGYKRRTREGTVVGKRP